MQARGSDHDGGGGVSGSNSFTGIPAIEITKDAAQATGVGYMCGDDDGDGDYMVDTPANANVNNARRRSTVTDISSYDHSPPERQQQQVRTKQCTHTHLCTNTRPKQLTECLTIIIYELYNFPYECIATDQSNIIFIYICNINVSTLYL